MESAQVQTHVSSAEEDLFSKVLQVHELLWCKLTCGMRQQEDTAQSMCIWDIVKS